MSTAAVGIGLANHEAVAAAKGGVEGLMRAAAATYAKQGIRVNAVAPGLTNTDLAERRKVQPASKPQPPGTRLVALVKPAQMQLVPFGQHLTLSNPGKPAA